MSNTGSWIAFEHAEKTGGIGLETLRRRLDLLYPNGYDLHMTSEDGWVKVRVCLATTMRNANGIARTDY